MKTEKTVKIIEIAAAAVLVVLGYFVFDSIRERVANVGDNAPGFQVTTAKGKNLTQKEFGGRVLLLNFWASWCPPCKEETPSMNQMAQALGPKGLVVLGVSVDENQAAYQQFLARERVVFDTALDATAEISANYGTFKYPETYVIGRDGKVLRKYIGPRDWSSPELLRDIESLL
ncbi:MAG TPA: TlpA disulfide reductase family protein [Bryobacteraceae bacterium]|nr:TlpA disulfide reductase family protein [Bryobacteraceae bacterium]